MKNTQHGFFFCTYRGIKRGRKREEDETYDFVNQKWGRKRKAPSKGPTPCPLKRPQDGAGATKTAGRSWRDRDGATELARRRSLQRRLQHGLIAEQQNQLAL